MNEFQLQQAATLPEIVRVLIDVCDRLGKNTELHVHFVIQSTVHCNSIINSAISESTVMQGDDNTCR